MLNHGRFHSNLFILALHHPDIFPPPLADPQICTVEIGWKIHGGDNWTNKNTCSQWWHYLNKSKLINLGLSPLPIIVSSFFGKRYRQQNNCAECDGSCGHYLGRGGQAKINATAHVYWHWCHRKLDSSINGYNVTNGLNALLSLSLSLSISTMKRTLHGSLNLQVFPWSEAA